MNIFGIIGPIMIGPSSSHTAGAVRIGRIAYKLMNGSRAIDAQIELSGSFASTYQGHGTDRALLAGLMGYETDSPEIRDAFEIAAERDFHYEFIPTNIPDTHPNTVRISFECEDGTHGQVMGASVGGGNIRIYSINGLKVDLTGNKTTLLVVHKDKPGMVAEITDMMRERHKEANICNLGLTRKEKGGEAMMTIELDESPSDSMKEDIESIDDVTNVIMINAI